MIASSLPSVLLPSLDGIGSGGEISLTISTPLKIAKQYPSFLRSRKSKSTILLNEEEEARSKSDYQKASQSQFERLRADAEIKSYNEGIEAVLTNFKRLSHDITEATAILEFGLPSEAQILGPFSERASALLSSRKALGDTITKVEQDIFARTKDLLAEAAKSTEEVLKRTQDQIAKSEPLREETDALLDLHSEISAALVGGKVPATTQRVKDAKSRLHKAAQGRKDHSKQITAQRGAS